MKRIVIIGATSSIAEHCARLWVQEPIDLTLVGRNQLKLDKIAQDLKVRSQQSVIATRVANFEGPIAIDELVSKLSEKPVDIALIAHGSLPDQQQCQSDLALNKETLEINGVSPVLFAEAFASHMERYNHGTLAINPCDRIRGLLVLFKRIQNSLKISCLNGGFTNLAALNRF